MGVRSSAGADTVKPDQFLPKYTLEQKQVFFSTYREMEGNLSGAAKKCGINEHTARYWIKQAARKQTAVSEEVAALAAKRAPDAEERVVQMFHRTLNRINSEIIKAPLLQQLDAAMRLVVIMHLFKHPPPRPSKGRVPEVPDVDEMRAQAEVEALRIVGNVLNRRNRDIQPDEPIDETTQPQ